MKYQALFSERKTRKVSLLCHQLTLSQVWWMLTLVMLNKLSCHTHFYFSANQITLFGLMIQIHILNGKQCRSRSVGFFRSQLIWIYTVCKARVNLVQQENGFKTGYEELIYKEMTQLDDWCHFIQLSCYKCCMFCPIFQHSVGQEKHIWDSKLYQTIYHWSTSI